MPVVVGVEILKKNLSERSKTMYNWIVFITGIASGVVLLVLGSASPWYGVLQSYFAGFVFWMLVVVIPEIRRKNAVYSFMVNRYRDFRLDLINNFLRAAGAWEHGRAEELLDPKKFRAFFGRKNEPFKTELIYAAESGIDSCPAFLGDIQVSFKHFSDEIDFAMSKIVSDDRRMYEELNFLKKRLYDLFHISCYKGDPSKYLGQFFWNTLGWWNEVYGDRSSDWIADAIEKLRR